MKRRWDHRDVWEAIIACSIWSFLLGVLLTVAVLLYTGGLA